MENDVAYKDMPALLKRVDDDSESESESDTEANPTRNQKGYKPAPTSAVQKTPLRHKAPGHKRPKSILKKPSDTFSDEESSDDDLLNEKVPDKQRVAAMDKAAHIISEYKTHLHLVANPTSTDSWLMNTIRTTITSADKIISPHKYKFENTREAAKFNTAILKRSKYDFSKALYKEKGTMLEPGSEFRSKQILEPLFSDHVHWEDMSSIITKGVTYSLEDLPESVRKEDLNHMIARGNHKSATSKENEEYLLQNYEKEVTRGWMLPVTFECVTKIKDAGVIPAGVATQFTIDDKGNRKTKRRTTHDASFPPPSEKSINNRMFRELLTNCFYGYCLIRILHVIHIMRYTHPCMRILICKLDLDAAYRRLHVLAAMAVLTITIIRKIAYILLRLPFGVANGPNDFSIVSEPIMDLTNDILRDDTWDPNDIHSPLQSIFKQPLTRYPTNTPFGRARKLFVPVPFHWAVADGYIDDIITVILDHANWITKGQNAAPLAVHTVFRPTDPNDPLPRADVTSIPKLDGEGTPDEVKTVLGWLLNTRLFRIYLPKLKARDWIHDIKTILRNKRVDSVTLESTIGRLNHAAHIIPQARYFLNRIRQLLDRCKKYGAQTPNKQERKDLQLWIGFLQKVSTKGIDINNITFTEPTGTTISDACEHGLGGFNSDGLAWRYELPPALIGKFSINLLEFIASAITIYLTIKNTTSPQKLLAFTDSSSALGWLYKASFTYNQPAHDEVARWLAKILIDNDSALYSQHIRGIHNIIADMLSRDCHIPATHLVHMFQLLLPQQTPKNFRISTLPPEIISWLHSLSPSLTKTPASPLHPSKSKLGALTDGNDSWNTMESKMSFLMDIVQNNAHTSCPHLQAAADEINMVKEGKQYSPEGLSSPPSRMFVRPFGRIFGQTQL